MYGFNDDKSKFNLGNWIIISVPDEYFLPGIASNDTVISGNFPTKYVQKINVSERLYLSQVLGGIESPTLAWEVTDAQGRRELTETEQENAAKISSVFFQNENIYIVADEKPYADMYILIKGA